MAQDFEERAGMMSARENLDQQTGTATPAATPEPTLEDRAGMMSARENLDRQTGMSVQPTIGDVPGAEPENFYITPPTPPDVQALGSTKTKGEKAALHVKLPIAAQAAGTGIDGLQLGDMIEQDQSSTAMTAIHSAAEASFQRTKGEALGALVSNPALQMSDEEVKRIGDSFSKPLFTDPEQASDFMYGYGLIDAMTDPRESLSPEFAQEMAGGAAAVSLLESSKRYYQLVENAEAEHFGRPARDMESEGMSAEFFSKDYWFNSGKWKEDNWLYRALPIGIRELVGMTQSEAASDFLSMTGPVANYATAEEGASIMQNVLGDWDAAITAIASLPPEERPAAIEAKLEDIQSNIPFPAFGVQKLFLERLGSMSDSMAVFEAGASAFGVLTGFTTSAVVKGGVSGTRAVVKSYRGSVQNAVQRAKSLGLKPRGQMTSEDLVRTVAEPEVATEEMVVEAVTTKQNTTEARQSLATTTGNMRAWLTSDGNITDEPTRRMLKEFTETGAVYDEIARLATDTVQRVDLENPEQVRMLVRNTRKQLELEQTPWLRHVIAAETRFPQQVVKDQATDTYEVSYVMGKLDGSGYKREQDARAFITRELDGLDATVDQIGGSYYVRHNRKAVERDGFTVLDDMALSKEQLVPVRMGNTWADKIRQGAKKAAGSANRVSAQSRSDRLKFEGFEANAADLLREAHVKRISGIGANKTKEIVRVLEADRVHSETIEVAPGVFERVQGRFAQSRNEFYERFQQINGKPPTEDHIRGYFSFVLLNDQDYALRNITSYSFKNQIGLRNYEVSVGDEIIDGIEGRIEKDIAWDKSGREAGIVVLGETPEFLLSKTYGAATKEVIQGKIKEGYKVIRLSPNGRSRIMTNGKIREKVGNDVADYVLVPGEVVSSPLPFQQVPYKPGGHIAYADGAMVSIPRLSRLNRGGRELIKFDGDISVLHFRSTEKAQKAVDALNKGIDIKKAGGKRLDVEAALRPLWGEMAPSLSRVVDSAEVPEYLEATVKQFGDNVADNLKLKEKIGDSNFLRLDNDEWDLYQGMNQEYMGPRNNLIGTAENIGSPDQPMFAREDAALVSYTDTAMQAMENIASGPAGTNIKIKEALAFHKQFGHMLRTPKEDLAANPILHALDPDWVNNYPNYSEMTAAKHAQKSLAMFLNQPTAESKFLRRIKQQFVDDIIQSVPSMKGQAILEEKALATTSDPVKFLRGAAFHLNLGLYNPKHFILQSSAWSAIFAIAGAGPASKGLTAYRAARWSMLTKKPHIHDHIAKKVMGWDSEQYTEAWGLLQETGFHRVGGQSAHRLDTEGPEIIKTKKGQFLNAGAFFFNEGERLPKMAGYFAAYSELAARKGKKTGAIKPTDLEKDWILRRADDLTYNMTRVGSAEWQRGLTSVPLQFITYQTRLMDHVFGHRLTKMEKARLMAVHTVLFGSIAGTAGTALGIAPWQELIKQELIDRGYKDEIEQNFILNSIVNGMPAAVLRMITGEQYDITGTLGPSGLSQFWDILNGDNLILNFITGPGGAEVRQFIENAIPLTEIGKEALLSFAGIGEMPPNEAVWDSIKQALSGISTVGNGMQLYKALSLARRETISGRLSSDDPATAVEAVMKFVTGVFREKDSDTFRYLDSTKEIEEGVNAAINEAAELRAKALKSNTQEAYKYYNEKSTGIYITNGLDFYPDALATIERRATQIVGEPIARQAREKWFAASPENRQEEAQQMIRNQEENNGR